VDLFQVLKLGRDSVFRTQMRPKVTGLAEEAKVKAFDASKSFKSGKKGIEAREEERRQPLDQLQRSDLDRWNPRPDNEERAQEKIRFGPSDLSTWTNNRWIRRKVHETSSEIIGTIH